MTIMNKLKMMLHPCIAELTMYAQGQSPVNPNANQKTKNILTYLKKVSKMKQIYVILFSMGVFFAYGQTPPANSIVAKHGMLKVVGSHVVNKNNEKISLAGNSLFWSNFVAAKKFYNDETVKILAQEWNSSIVRAAMGATHSEPGKPHENGYVADLANGITEEKDITEDVIQAAIKYGIYVIIDWHSHEAEQSWNKTKAIEFFTEMADKYGHHDNVIYEIYNEPINTPWPTIKSYAEDVIDAIRSKDPDNLIIVGTRTWSQRVEEASLDQIDDVNVAYTLHFYAAAPGHRQNLRDEASRAMDNGIAIFVTEWGMSEAGGGGSIDYGATNDWMDFFKENYISHVNWSISDVHESSAALNNSAGMEGLRTDNLRPAGREAKKIIENWNVPSPPVGNSVSWNPTPTSVSNGNNSFTLNYSIDQNGIILLQLYDSNWSFIGEVFENVSAGTGQSTLSLSASNLSQSNNNLQVKLLDSGWQDIGVPRLLEKLPLGNTPPTGGNSLSWDTTPTSVSNGNNTFTLNYSIDQNGIILLQLYDSNWSFIGEVIENVSAGTGQSTLSLSAGNLSQSNNNLQVKLLDSGGQDIGVLRLLEKLPLGNTPPTGGTCELITNGNFDTGVSNWNSWGCTPSSVNGTANLSITDAGSYPWNVGFTQQGLTLEQGKTYTITLRARADANRSINVKLGGTAPNWTNYGTTTFNLTTSMQTYTFPITMNNSTDNNTRFEIFLGGSWTKVYIDEVSLSVDCNNKQDLNITQDIELYPNPANHNIQLTYKLSENTQAQIQVNDAFGKLVKYINNVELLTGLPTEIEVSDLPAGVYFCTLQSGEWQAVKKFVIAR